MSNEPVDLSEPEHKESLTDLAQPTSKLDKILQYVPRALSSKLHVIFLAGLGIYLILLPAFGLHVSAFAELIGGNYTNVTSDIGACIAAGGTLHLVRNAKKRNRLEQERLALTKEIHKLLHLAHPELAKELGQKPAE
jgi:predicted phage tail protein